MSQSEDPRPRPIHYWQAAVIHQIRQQQAASLTRLRSRQVKIYAVRMCQEMFARKQFNKQPPENSERKPK